MSDGHGDGGGDCGIDHAMYATPVPGASEAAEWTPAPRAPTVINGVEINRAPVRETAKEWRAGWREGI